MEPFDDDSATDRNPAALELCDAVDNDCSGAADDEDGDLDGFLVCADCNDGDGTVHATPTAILNLRFATAVSLSWDAPLDPGGSVVVYDTIRSSTATDFVGAEICVESDDGSDTGASDADLPAVGQLFYYLARAENTCGAGPTGADSDGLERVVDVCP